MRRRRPFHTLAQGPAAPVQLVPHGAHPRHLRERQERPCPYLHRPRPPLSRPRVRSAHPRRSLEQGQGPPDEPRVEGEAVVAGLLPGPGAGDDRDPDQVRRLPARRRQHPQVAVDLLAGHGQRPHRQPGRDVGPPDPELQHRRGPRPLHRPRQRVRGVDRTYTCQHEPVRHRRQGTSGIFQGPGLTRRGAQQQQIRGVHQRPGAPLQPSGLPDRPSERALPSAPGIRAAPAARPGPPPGPGSRRRAYSSATRRGTWRCARRSPAAARSPCSHSPRRPAAAPAARAR